ncbi:MAG: FAD-binding protein [Ruminococcaceae bacterium]|nr:FAD-binding protein [Oscillospiraceae bacterium]
MYDIIIVGAGPAGMTAGIYARRANKSVLIIDKGSFGGQITFSPKIENYPAFNEISGTELADKILEQALALGVDVEIDTVVDIIENEDGNKSVIAQNNTYAAKAVIIAAGAAHRKLGIEGEEKFIGEGISFCAVCDGAFYKDKSVLLIGGGNSAMQEALQLSDVCTKVTMVQNLPYLTGEDKLAEQIAKKDNIAVIYNSTVDSIIENTNGTFAGINIDTNGEKSSLYADGMFVAIGLAPENEPFRNVADLNEFGYIRSSESCLTKTNGVFVAGDCRTKQVRQIATAIADGAVAAIAASKYVK